jgi:hypothetical protein
MKVVMLAAGTGARLGIDELVLGVGHHHKDIVQEIVALGAQGFV